MKSPSPLSRFRNRPFLCYGPTALVCAALLLPEDPIVFAQQAESPVMTTTTQEEAPAPKIANDQLDSLVAPIALYPDPLLSQALVASTYPLEIIQLEQWMAKNKNLKDKALADAVAKQPWDPSIQGLAAFPDVVTRLAENVAWTSDLGNAFLAQQTDVMAAVQRMRAKAQGTGNLKTSAQQKVETQTVEGKEVIVVQQANPEVVYIPSYDPAVVYGPPAYPYYPYTYPGYVPGMGLAFGAGLALGAAWGGGWGYGCGWGNGDININNNNNFNRNNINNINRGQGGGKWQHNAAHRGSVPYGNRQTANKFGGTARNASTRPAGGGMGNRPGGGAGAGNRPGGGAGAGNRPGGGTGAGNRPGGGTGAGNRPGGGAGAGTRPATRPSGGGANSIGNRSVSSTTFGAGDRGGGGSRGGGGGGGFSGGGFGGGSGASARSASSRGGHSMGGGGFSGGGGSRGGGGGGRGGGGRGGGGRRR